MAWRGPETRCTLQVNLRRYHEHLVPGAKGTLVPNVMTTKYGTNPRFGAVRFDCCGHTLDIVLANLDLEWDATSTDEEPPTLTSEERQTVKELLGSIDD